VEVSSELHGLTTFYLGKEFLVLLDRRLGGLQSWSGYGGRETKSLHCLCQELNLGHPKILCVRYNI
jgi:hypothetical protein